jgi:thiol:disulfide interchange protein
VTNPQGDPKTPANPTDPATASRWPWRFVLLVAVLFAAVVIAGQVRRGGGQDRVAWGNSFDQATVKATEASKPLLVLFTADWCPACKQLKAWVLSDQGVADAIEAGFVPIKVDLTEEGLPDRQVAERYGVQSIPTLLTLTPDGQTISRSLGYVDKAELLGWLDTATQRYAKLQAEDAGRSATALVEDKQAE